MSKKGRIRVNDQREASSMAKKSTAFMESALEEPCMSVGQLD
jgi:hypothetical protein